MLGEVNRALAFKASLTKLPVEKYIVFYCQTKPTKDQIDWNAWRKVSLGVPGLSLPGMPSGIYIPSFEPPYDFGQKGDGTVPAHSANPQGAVPAIAVNGFHMWIPSMQAVHTQPRIFLVGP